MEYIKLKDLCEKEERFVAPNDDAHIDYVDISSVDNKSKSLTKYDTYIFAEAPSRARKRVKHGDVIVSTVRPNLNAVARFNIQTPHTPIASTGFCVLRHKSDVDPIYIYFFCISPNFVRQMVAKATGASYPAVSDTIVREAKLPKHTAEKRVRIVSTLSKAKEIIEHRCTQLAKLDELVKCRFVELFGDGRSNPKQWETKKLEEIASVGSSKRVFVEDLIADGVPFYRGTEVGALAEGQNITPELFISESHYRTLCEASGRPVKGDLLMPSICPDGRIWLVDSDSPFYFKDGRVLWVHDIHEQFNPVFLQYTLKDRIITDYASIASGTTFAELKIFTLKSCKIFDVPLSLQNTFAAFIHRVDKLRFVIQKSLDETQKLFDSLMQEYFD